MLFAIAWPTRRFGECLEIIEFFVLVAEVADVGFDGEGFSGGALDEFVGGEGAAVAVDVLLEPGAEGLEAASFDFGGDVRVGCQGGFEELGVHDIAEGVALEGAADEVAEPVDVLEEAVLVVGWGDAEIALVGGPPGVGQVGDSESAFEEVQAQLEADHDMEVVGDFVGVGADEAGLDAVDGAVEGIEVDGAELVGEGLLELGVEVVPEGLASAYEVFPES